MQTSIQVTLSFLLTITMGVKAAQIVQTLYHKRFIKGWDLMLQIKVAWVLLVTHLNAYFDFNTKSGTGPWVGVPQQYSFITGNTSKKGPYGQVNSLCATQVGDIIQLYNASVPPDNIWDHEAIVVTSPYPYCGSLSTYLIDAHTTDRYHYPLSNWASYYPNNMRSVLILGWKGN